MPMHDWKRVEAGIFHHFHHEWISEIQRALNAGLLPEDYYALAEQLAAGKGPDVLTLQRPGPNGGAPRDPTGIATLSPPKASFTAKTAEEYYRKKKSSIAVRHVSDDRMVAVIEVLSPGNKSSKKAFRKLLDKVCYLLELKIHLLLIDPLPPTKRDPHGLHAAVWSEIGDGIAYVPPKGKPLTLAAYESARVIRAFVEPFAVGDELPDMPLILEPGGAVSVPLEATYRAAFAAVPRRWRTVLEPG